MYNRTCKPEFWSWFCVLCVCSMCHQECVCALFVYYALSEVMYFSGTRYEGFRRKSEIRQDCGAKMSSLQQLWVRETLKHIFCCNSGNDIIIIFKIEGVCACVHLWAQFLCLLQSNFKVTMVWMWLWSIFQDLLLISRKIRPN